MCRPKMPKPPDPMETAAAQTGTNVGTAMANQILQTTNQVTPFGSLTYEQTGATQWTDPSSGQVYNLPRFTATQTLSPIQQQTLDAQQRAGLQAAGLADREMGRLSAARDASAMPTAPTYQQMDWRPEADFSREATNLGRVDQDFTGVRDRAEMALMSRLTPQLDRDRESLRASLVQQGIREGSEAFDRAMNRADEAATDARMQAILAGGQEMSRSTQDALARTGFNNNARGQEFEMGLRQRGFNNDLAGQVFARDMAARQFNNAVARAGLEDALQLRNQPINEIGALMGTGQVQNPNFVSTPGVTMPGVDTAGLIMDNYGQRLNNWQTQQAQRQSLMGGLLGTAGNIGAGLILSDRRLKRDVVRVGTFGRLAVYVWTYLWGERGVGFMADEVAQIAPDAVVRVGAFDAVDYGKAMEAAT